VLPFLLFDNKIAAARVGPIPLSLVPVACLYASSYCYVIFGVSNIEQEPQTAGVEFSIWRSCRTLPKGCDQLPSLRIALFLLRGSQSALVPNPRVSPRS